MTAQPAAPIEEPASEPGVFAVGASTAQPGVSCRRRRPGRRATFRRAAPGSRSTHPGAGLPIKADPFTDQALCCGMAPARRPRSSAASLTALMSYDPNLSYTTAENLLVQSAAAGPEPRRGGSIQGRRARERRRQRQQTTRRGQSRPDRRGRSVPAPPVRRARLEQQASRPRAPARHKRRRADEAGE